MADQPAPATPAPNPQLAQLKADYKAMFNMGQRAQAAAILKQIRALEAKGS